MYSRPFHPDGRFPLAEEQGVEPRYNGSKPFALPLCYSSTNRKDAVSRASLYFFTIVLYHLCNGKVCQCCVKVCHLSVCVSFCGHVSFDPACSYTICGNQPLSCSCYTDSKQCTLREFALYPFFRKFEIGFVYFVTPHIIAHSVTRDK